MPAAHTQRRRGGAREAGAASSRQAASWEVRAAGPREPLRHRAPAGRGKGWRALIPAPLLALRGREAGGSERRVSSPSASQLTASKQPFLKANCHRRSEPPPAPRPAWIRPSLGGGSGGVTAPPQAPAGASPALASRTGVGGSWSGAGNGAAPGIQPPPPGPPRRTRPVPRSLAGSGPRLGCSPLCCLGSSVCLRSCKVQGRFALKSSRLVAEEMLQLVLGTSPS